MIVGNRHYRDDRVPEVCPYAHHDADAFLDVYGCDEANIVSFHDGFRVARMLNP